ncbi:hypothetical protein [Paraburkholderia saeva]|uniref:Adhesin n=1 Tax=Paraburkholderia saeva TaxID=2777537 RepID=A0A9N8RZA7_9BURK|nr:hypothetical protein [Paraburkholderia saeva]CAG4907098.1 hypothetical protein LMG31841_03632 [Paraburkholderia saeva]CAG4920380.1 hypothetical protein R52603_04850 [Paraburkholderia saeva]CAG4926573.1 hypothetical protein R70241_05488 [Paraburkholderia saeva]
MTVSRETTRGHSQHAPRLAALLLGALAAGSATLACAQQVVNPGDIIVERQITPRIAYDNVPKSQDPVLVRATTFPANSFNPMMATAVSDADLTSAHGSTGLADGGVGAAGLQAVTRILSGNTTGNNVALNNGNIGAPAPGIGGTISSSVSGALAPLSTALGGALGGLK